MLALIERAGVTTRHEAMELYLEMCERLASRDCLRLRHHDWTTTALSAWLAVVTRDVIVDWARSGAGRRAFFAVIKHLDDFDQCVFELYYSEERTPWEIAAILKQTRGGPNGAPVQTIDVLDALDRIQALMRQRHRSELLSLAARSGPSGSVEAEIEDARPHRRFNRAHPETAAIADIIDVTSRAKQLEALFATAVAALPPQDAAIVRLKYVQGLTDGEIQRALHLDRLGDARLQSIAMRLRAALAAASVDAGDASASGLAV
jgi:DNA-directed RNA polymerase specialized sigma24 family protein